MTDSDSEFMRMALTLAHEAAAAGETPIGAVAVIGGEAVGSARNRVEEKQSSSAHAELELLHELESRRGDWRMEDVTVYVTKEPCPMCAGALVNARVRRIVYGVADPRFGGCSVFGIPAHPGALFHPEVTGGVCAGEAAALLYTTGSGSDLRWSNWDLSAPTCPLNIFRRIHISAAENAATQNSRAAP